MRRDKIEIYIHILWTTWNREFLITPSLEVDLFPLLVAMGERHRAHTLMVNGVPDHIHWLVRFSSTTLLCDLVKDAKGTSSKCLNETLGNFKWRPTYSVSPWNVPKIKDYIARQKEHHADKTFKPRLEPGRDEDFFSDK